ncbi:AmmeMemoRadiSam system radical SAM enzyme [bacterium]|nr:AmmeMemoRadiSam system radical SAM enzyme [bacterium]
MSVIHRRKFLSSAAWTACALICPTPGSGSGDPVKEARYYDRLEDKRVQCHVCPWHCLVEAGRRGHCDVRLNDGGTYRSLVYGQVAARHIDPIEKKPFYHFHPGSAAMSIATAGCNLDCKFCQNADLAQRRPEELRHFYMAPGDVVQAAVENSCLSIAYTYNEPVIYLEYMMDIAAAGRERKIRSVVISNGFINTEPLRDLCRVIDAYKVDLKAFTDSYYQEIVGGHLKPVLDTLVTLKEENVWTEIVYLVVPTLNDDTASLQEMVRWVTRELGTDVPLHFSRFYPKYKLKNLPPTPVATLEKACAIARDAGLHFVYMGNVPGHAGESTLCPGCGRIVIRRIGYDITENHVRKGQCEFCTTRIAGRW